MRPNHALQRTAPRVTVAATLARTRLVRSWLCPTSVAALCAPPSQLPRHAPPSLSLGSLGHSRLHDAYGEGKTPRCRIQFSSRPPFRASMSHDHPAIFCNSLGRNSPASGGTTSGSSSTCSHHNSCSTRQPMANPPRHLNVFIFLPTFRYSTSTSLSRFSPDVWFPAVSCPAWQVATPSISPQPESTGWTSS